LVISFLRLAFCDPLSVAGDETDKPPQKGKGPLNPFLQGLAIVLRFCNGRQLSPVVLSFGLHCRFFGPLRSARNLL